MQENEIEWLFLSKKNIENGKLDLNRVKTKGIKEWIIDVLGIQKKAEIFLAIEWEDSSEKKKTFERSSIVTILGRLYTRHIQWNCFCFLRYFKLTQLISSNFREP